MDKVRRVLIKWRDPNRSSFLLFLRPHRTDQDLVKGIPNENELLDIGSFDYPITVLDIGAHIGGFTNWICANYDVGRIIAVEPFKENFNLLKLNTRDLDTPVILKRAAVVGEEGVNSVPFYLNRGRSHGRHTLRPTRGRDEIVVPAVFFNTLVQKYKPEVLKIDVEGAEYSYYDSFLNLPNSVKRLSIEFHFYKSGDLDRCKSMVSRIIEKGFKIVRDPGFSDKSMNGVMVFIRE